MPRNVHDWTDNAHCSICESCSIARANHLRDEGHDVEMLQDYCGTIDELRAVLNDLAEAHGPYSLIGFDGGHNNVSVKILKRVH